MRNVVILFERVLKVEQKTTHFWKTKQHWMWQVFWLEKNKETDEKIGSTIDSNNDGLARAFLQVFF